MVTQHLPAAPTLSNWTLRVRSAGLTIPACTLLPLGTAWRKACSLHGLRPVPLQPACALGQGAPASSSLKGLCPAWLPSDGGTDGSTGGVCKGGEVSWKKRKSGLDQNPLRGSVR